MKKLFLILLAFALPAVAYISFGIYTNWKTDQEIERMYQNSVAEHRKLYQDAVEYEKLKQKSIEKETKLLKQDTYGGKTPEETLELFVQALKQKDPELASKYYLPWKQEEAKKEMEDWIENYPDGLKKFLDAYDLGEVTVYSDGSLTDYVVVDITAPNETTPYELKMQLNKINQIWKISEF